MSLGRDLVSCIIQTGELQPCLDAGFTLEWLADPNGGREGIFEEADRQAYELILTNWNEFGRVMSVSRFLRNWPAFEFANDDDSTLAELVKDSVTSAQRTQLEFALGGVGQVLTDGKVAEAVDQLGMWTQHIAGTATLNSQELRVLARSDLDSLLDPDYLIDGFVDRGYLMSLFGKFGTAKSFVALDWACHITTGMDWQNRKTKQGKVLYIASEGGWGQKLRVAAWEKRFNKGRKISSDMLHFMVHPIQLQNPDHLAFLVKACREEEYDLIIIDTQARSTVGLDENSAQDMGQVVESLIQLRDAWEDGATTCLLIHHAGKNGTDRGSSAIPGAVDSQYKIEVENGNDPVGQLPGPFRLSCVKRKDGEPPLPLPIELEKVPLTQDDVPNLAEGGSSLTVRVLEDVRPAPNRTGQIVALLQEGKSQEEIMVELGVSRASYYRGKAEWKKVYDKPLSHGNQSGGQESAGKIQGAVNDSLGRRNLRGSRRAS